MTTRLAAKTGGDNIVQVLAGDGPTEGFAIYVSTDQPLVNGGSRCVCGNAKEMILNDAE